MITIGALLDMIGVASILPFMAVLTNPSIVDTNLALNILYQASYNFGVENIQQFLFALGVLVFVTLVITLIFKAFTFYAQIRFIQMCEYGIAKRLVEGYLKQAYSWFLSRNSAELGKNILSEVGAIIGYGINPFLGFVSKGLVAIAIISLLIIADPKLTLIVGSSLGISYVIIFYSIRNYLKKLGKVRFKKNQLRFSAISEAFGAAKEVKVGGLEQVYIKRFSDPAHSFAEAQASSSTIAQLPRFFLEAIGFGGIILLILYMMTKTGNFNNALPIISLYVFAGYRLLPALQVLYSSFAQFTFVGPALDKLYYDIKNLEPSHENQDQGVISLNENITLKNIHYNYPNSSRITLNDISINIPAKSTVGLVGATGSGKTTIVDIILGLLEAQKGTLEIDGKVITKQNSRSWQKSIGYVPQFIYLSDDSVTNNIAFGVETKCIDQKAVEKAAKIANLHNFVIEELPKQYQTTIGERGVRLSGGQRQRIGIARALYHNPKLLILDEATSSLDNQTEEVVMEAVNNLGKKDITIILIAHRLNTVKNCDVIFKLQKGQVIDQGSFDKIITSNKNLSSFS
ncbi:lipid A export ATP-binding/permease protein MsbA [Candidatus Pelagibacter sp. HTCC7211]|uniref:ABC transporter ATP-binding protein n=1 Tax=Pelagibacter sp. (strain HTCC7211) TaxID=439493 RepID=UPI000183A8D1|nr:ABC transporter ATP-binding protein [Candidatus Pelagibacter sp. HTCC7211]EDZ60301.1 lipid A export ATP-binding/permease protein MsbA [Candidatus Pelagibacter sp. HTCC7211]